MARDTQSKINSNKQSKSSKYEDKKVCKKNGDDDSDNDSSTPTDEEDVMDSHEFRRYLSKIFPSKYLDNLLKKGDKLKKNLADPVEENNDENKHAKKSKNLPPIKSKNTTTKKDVKKSKRDKDESDTEEGECGGKNSEKFNIKFTIQYDSDDDEEDDDEEDEWEDCDDDDSDYDSDYDSEDDSDYDSDYDSEDEEDDEEEEDEEEEEIKVKVDKHKRCNTRNSKQSKKKSHKEKTGVKVEEEEEVVVDTNETESNVKTKLETEESLLISLKEMINTNKGNKTLIECIKKCEANIAYEKTKLDKKTKKQKQKNMRTFLKNLRGGDTTCDSKFFKKLQIEEQNKLIGKLHELKEHMHIEKPYRITLLETDIPPIFKTHALKKINCLRYMDPESGEYFKNKNWVDTFMKIPFGKYQQLPVSIEDGVEKCHEFMEQAQKTLDTAVYGLNDAKMQIMQMLGQLVINPSSIGTAIAIHGNPGTGKTSLVKEGISKILNRPFAFIALGGATDSSFLEGHSYTYEGSVWGKIVQILIDSKCMNPVIYFDELDKISETPKGEEIAGILTHLTDTTQNNQFHDKYFSEIDFDLSKCLFIFSYNDESKVNPILRDRMYRIKTKGYDSKEKMVISNQYLLPKIREQVKFLPNDIIIPTEVLQYIIENHCNKEEGVRNLKRSLEIIYTKLNLYRLMKPGTNLFEKEMSIKVEFPFNVSIPIIDKLIKRENDSNLSYTAMYM